MKKEEKILWGMTALASLLAWVVIRRPFVDVDASQLLNMGPGKRVRVQGVVTKAAIWKAPSSDAWGLKVHMPEGYDIVVWVKGLTPCAIGQPVTVLGTTAVLVGGGAEGHDELYIEGKSLQCGV